MAALELGLGVRGGRQPEEGAAHRGLLARDGDATADAGERGLERARLAGVVVVGGGAAVDEAAGGACARQQEGDGHHRRRERERLAAEQRRLHRLALVVRAERADGEAERVARLRGLQPRAAVVVAGRRDVRADRVGQRATRLQRLEEVEEERLAALGVERDELRAARVPQLVSEQRLARAVGGGARVEHRRAVRLRAHPHVLLRLQPALGDAVRAIRLLEHRERREDPARAARLLQRERRRVLDAVLVRQRRRRAHGRRRERRRHEVVEHHRARRPPREAERGDDGDETGDAGHEHHAAEIAVGAGVVLDGAVVLAVAGLGVEAHAGEHRRHCRPRRRQERRRARRGRCRERDEHVARSSSSFTARPSQLKFSSVVVGRVGAA